MDHKAEAKKLISKFFTISKSFTEAKECALIAVEFARQEFRDHCVAEIDIIGNPDDHFDAIKQEIEKR